MKKEITMKDKSTSAGEPYFKYHYGKWIFAGIIKTENSKAHDTKTKRTPGNI